MFMLHPIFPNNDNIIEVNFHRSKQNQVKINTDLTVLSVVGDRFLQSDFLPCIRRPQNQKLDAGEEVTLKKSVAKDRQNFQFSVNFNLDLFGWKFTSVLINEPDEFVQ